MSSIDDLFSRLKADGQTAFMPFITAGDPNLNFTGELLKSLSDAGCHLVELGFPYSDPIADGPTIQDSYTRALKNKIKVADIFKMLDSVSGDLKMPVVAMVSFAIVHRYGTEKFLHRAKAAGLSGLIVPDLPVDESQGLAELCASNDLSLIQLVTPTTSDERALKIAELSTGFVYYVSIAGITGERTSLPDDLASRLEWLKSKTDKPICVGFGVSQPEQGKMLSQHADGVIVGSAIVGRIGKAENEASAMSDVVEFAKSMLDGVAS